MVCVPRPRERGGCQRHAVAAAECVVRVAAFRAADVAGQGYHVMWWDYDVQVARVHAMLLAHVRRTGRPRGVFMQPARRPPRGRPPGRSEQGLRSVSR
jgi:hypothetical protein